MKKFCFMFAIIGISLLLLGGNATALSNPAPEVFGEDDGTELFRPSEGVVSVEFFDFFGTLPIISAFGFFFEETPDTLIPIFGPTDQDPDPSTEEDRQIAVIDFSQGKVFDMDDPTDPVPQNTFTGTGNIGFFLLIDLPDPDPLPDPLIFTTVSSLNPGGADLAATFPLLSDPNAYLIGFDLPGIPGVPESGIAFEMVIGVEPIPEPGTFLFLGSGLIGLGIVYRKKLKKSLSSR